MDKNCLLKRENKLLKECLWSFTSFVKREKQGCCKSAFFERLFTNIEEISNFLQISKYIAIPAGLEVSDEWESQETSYLIEEEEKHDSISTTIEPSSEAVYCSSESDEKGEQDELCSILNVDYSSHISVNNNHNNSKISEIVQLKGFPKICQSCQKPVEDPGSLNSHFVKCGSECQATCGICTRKFERRKDVLAHIISVHKLSDILCFTCFKTFCNDESYLQHQSFHEELILRCGKCLDDVTYPTRELFIIHLQQHPQFVCGLCSDDMLNIASLSHHLTKKHKIRIYGREKYKENSCDVCMITLPSLDDREEHLASTAHLEAAQTSIKPCSCLFCDQSFPGRLQMFMHMKKEHHKNGKKIYFCPHCDYTSATLFSLLLHTPLHFSLRNIICDQCGGAFYDQSSYRKHCIYKHSDARPFSCSVCGLKFKEKYAVKKHMVSHSTERDTICFVCGADFKAHVRLRKHMANVHRLGPNQVNLKRVKLIDVPEELQYSKGVKASYGKPQPLGYLLKEQQTVCRRKRRKSLRNQEYLEKLCPK